MATSRVGRHGDGQQDQGQGEVEAQVAQAQQDRIGGFIDDESGRRDDAEAPRGPQQRSAVAVEAQAMVAAEGKQQGRQPAPDIGQQRGPAAALDQQHNDAEMERRCGAADGDEPGHASALASHPSARQRRIAICVDDFGLHAGVNRAALRLARAGRASAIACLVGAPAWPAGWPALAALRRDAVELGLHLDLTEFPLIAASRRSWPALLAAACSGRIDRRLLRAEVAAQLDVFEQSLGCRPAFIDGHRHVHQLPVVRDLLIELLDERGLRPWLRSTRGPRATPAPQRFKSWVIEALGAAGLCGLAARHGLATNRHLLGVYDFAGGAPRYRALLRDWLAAAQDGDLLMCHPSLPVAAEDRILTARVAEYEVLAGDGLGVALAQARLQVQPLGGIVTGPS